MQALISLNDVKSAAALDLLPHSSVLDDDAAVGGIARGARRSIAAVNEKPAAIGAGLAADGAEGVAVLHVVEHDFLGYLPRASRAWTAVLAALRAGVVAALAGVRQGGTGAGARAELTMPAPEGQSSFMPLQPTTSMVPPSYAGPVKRAAL